MWSRATQPGTRPPGLMRELRVRHGCRANGGVPSHPPVPLAAIPAAPSVPPHERPTRPSARPIRRHGVLASAGALLAISTLLAVAALAMPDRSSVGADRDSSTANTTSPATLPAPTLTVGGKPTDRNLQPPAPALAIPSTLGSPIEVAPTPASISLAPDSRHAYVLHGPAGLLTVLDTATDEVTGRIDLQSGSPQHLSVTRDGSKAFVSVLGAPPSGSAVAVVDTATSVVLATFPLDRRPGPLTVGPDQRFLYVASSGAAVTVIDATTGRLITEVALPGEPGAIRISPDGAWGYVTVPEQDRVVVFDTTDYRILPPIEVGANPRAMALSPDGKLLAVTSFGSNQVFLLDTVSRQVVHIVRVGTGPIDVAFTPDGRYLYTADAVSGTITVVDPETGAPTASIPTPSPTSVSFLPDGTKAYVTNKDAGTVTVLHAAS